MSDDEKKNPWRRKQPIQEDDADEIRVWRILVFGLIGATATTLMVGRFRRTYDWVYTQLNRSESYRTATSSSNRSSFREEAWKRYNRRMQEEHEEEMERVERIRRMQSVFNRERNKYKKNTESWGDNGPGAYQHFQRDDWYWKADPSYKDWRANSRATPRDNRAYPLSHHYSVLGLDRSRASPYSEAEIKTAFRTKAKEYHPDQNQNNKEAAEAKFKEVMMSYEAIKLERNGKSCSN
eukprot:TRINITY_DN7584_c0_g1_i2.p1 TRINITY_DN7584_c0_g1~~TRINITY_DN7584_c0_g1_i2.p1  ORF type:complete len:237 (-),score=40.47 TRINITY_DN7584_c0_g1_i2:268-978(-)